jgi:formate hydrogenlyase subunit 3/multisubunit Na+/H+ antiporter MnhD subunit
VWRAHNVLQYVVGSWDPPLGVAFRADGLSAAMIVTAALLICGIGLFARAQFPAPAGAEARAPLVFWTLLLVVGGRSMPSLSGATCSTFMSLSSC